MFGVVKEEVTMARPVTPAQHLIFVIHHCEGGEAWGPHDTEPMCKTTLRRVSVHGSPRTSHHLIGEPNGKNLHTYQEVSRDPSTSNIPAVKALSMTVV